MSEKELKKIKLLQVKCMQCNEHFELTNNLICANGINHKIEFTYREEGKDDKKLYLTYYVCPKCGKKYFVQIDDDTSLKSFKTISKNFIKLARMKRNGDVPKKKQQKFNKQRKMLEVYRNNLKTEFTGKSIHDDRTDEEFILVFSI